MIFSMNFRGRWWPVLCMTLALSAVSLYLLMILGNWAYLGWSDTLYFFSHPRMWQRFWLTVWTSSISSFFAMLVGIPTGYALSRFKFPCHYFFSSIIDLPIVVSPAIIGAFLFGITTRFPFDWISDYYGIYIGRNVYGVLLVQFTVTAAFCARLMKASFDMIPPRFESVSRSLGGGKFQDIFQGGSAHGKKRNHHQHDCRLGQGCCKMGRIDALCGGRPRGKQKSCPLPIYLELGTKA